MPSFTWYFALFLFLEEAGGKEAFPYTAVFKKNKNIRVSGLPHPFKKPSAHGAKQLREILDHRDRIIVHIDEGG